MPGSPGTEQAAIALAAKAWPFEEARKLLDRIGGRTDRPVVFETGYGPSGLPHIGTFGEVVRTSMVRRAFAEISDRPTRLICFSDDMDGLRAVPDNIPEPARLAEAVGLPLARVPDPFGTHASFGAHNNARLRAFLDRFGFEYEFISSLDQYQAGVFDELLLRVLQRYDDVCEIVLPTLGAERRMTYSPFLPVSPSTGRVLQVPLKARDPARGTIAFTDENGEDVEIPVTGGHAKLQWRVDWAMRWVAFGVDYEMSGKDLIDSVRESSKIARVLEGVPPVGISYEHFLDADGQKISKSKGNGLSVEEWLAYAPSESLAYFMYAKPKTAKRLYLDSIPTAVDDYHRELRGYPELAGAARLESAVWHVHAGDVPASGLPVSFRMLLNLAAVTGAESKERLWEFLRRSQPEYAPDTHPKLDAAAACAVRYFLEVLRPRRSWHHPDPREAEAIRALRDALAAHPGEATAEALQEIAYEIGKAHWGDLRGWFRLLYQTLLGHDQGPRFGAFVAIYGTDNTVALIDRALAGEFAGRCAGPAD